MIHESGWSFFGMHLIWWFIWIAFISTAFSLFTPVPKSQMRSGVRALDILRRRYAAGRVTDEEYTRRKAVLERDEPNSDSSVSPRGHH